MSANGELYTTIEDAKEELKNYVKNSPGSHERAISEISDSAVPYNTAEILEMARENLFLATHCPEFSTEEMTPEEAISQNIREYVYHDLWSYWTNELEDNLLELEMEKWE